MDTAQVWTAILGGLGAAGVLGTLAKGFVKQWNGSYSRERGRNADIVRQRDDAYARTLALEQQADHADARADFEARERRRAQEYASELRRDLVERGVPPTDLRPWPTAGTPPPPPGGAS